MNQTAAVNAPSSLIRAPVAVLLAWVLPGLGHIYLGHRTRGIILLVAVTLTFWTGVALGGAKTVSQQRPPIDISKALPGQKAPSVPVTRSWWFFGQVLVGGYAVSGLALNASQEDYDESGSPRYLAWPSADLANVYTGVAGLLNLLIILDALARAEGPPAPGPHLARTAARAGPGKS